MEKDQPKSCLPIHIRHLSQASRASDTAKSAAGHNFLPDAEVMSSDWSCQHSMVYAPGATACIGCRCALSIHSLRLIWEKRICGAQIFRFAQFISLCSA